MINESGMSPEQQLAKAGVTLATISKYIYEFKQGKNSVRDLTNDAVNQLGEYFGISIESTDIIAEDDKCITIKAVAIKGDLRHVGIIRQKKQESSGRDKQFALENAISKAQRNAKKGLLPMATIREYINKVSDPNYNAAADSEARLEKAKTVYLEQQETIREMQKELDELKKLNERLTSSNKELGAANADMREVLILQKQELDAAKGMVSNEPGDEPKHMVDEDIIEQNNEDINSENLPTNEPEKEQYEF